MKFSVGYQLWNDESFVNELIVNAQSVQEVYFSWPGFANGRSDALKSPFFSQEEAKEHQLRDLKRLAQHGICFNLLFNGNCYGKDSQSKAFFQKISETVEKVQELFGLNSVTTTSPLIAAFLKQHFSSLEVRASVNMEISTVQGMEYLKDTFDGFYMKREHNRNFKIIRELRTWCDKEGKKLYMLANSGCLNHCSVHHFHDNLVAHEEEISKLDNVYDFRGICKDYLLKQEHWISLVRDSNFIRPEDISLYEEYFSAVKLATRVNRNPVKVLKSYISGHYHGNLLDLLEPAHSIYPYVLENAYLTNQNILCDKHCETCNGCREMIENALVRLEDVLC